MKKKALLIVAACACFITGCGAEKSTENKMKITESLHSASGESVSCLASVFTTQDGLLHIFDPNQKYVYTKEMIVSKSKNSPFIGKELKGKVKYTIVGGRIVYEDKM